MVEHRAWSEGRTRDEILSSRLARRFANSLEDVPLVAGSVECLRAFNHVPIGMLPQRADSGPPPSNNAGAGRYNNAGTAVLYLGDSIDAVRLEVPPRTSPRWVQRYVLPAGLGIADFSTLPPNHPASQAFWFAEVANRDSSNARGYLFSQVIAELARARFPQGMRVLGTRSAALQYRNIVIFDYSSWSDWLSGEPFTDSE